MTHRWENLYGLKLMPEAGEVRASRCVHCGCVRIAEDTAWGPRLFYYRTALDAQHRYPAHDKAGPCARVRA